MNLKALLVGLFLALLAGATTSAHAQAVLKPGDVFELRASGMPLEYAQQLALQFTVADDGTVDIPYIGNMKAGGISTTAFTKSVEKKFIADKIFTHPTVVMSLNFGSRVVTVSGEVRAPQAVPWSTDLTLSQAVTRAGSWSEFAKQRAKVTREGKAYLFNLKNREKDPSQNPKLLPGDEVEAI